MTAETKLVEFAEAIIQFFTSEIGGRKTALKITSLTYMPHFRLTEGSELLGVRFVGGPSEINPGETVKVQVHFVYPQVNYDGLQVGSEFYLCEGPSPIGKGKIIRRWIEKIENKISFRSMDQECLVEIIPPEKK